MYTHSPIISEILKEEDRLQKTFSGKLFMIFGNDYRIRKLKEVLVRIKILDLLILLTGWAGSILSVMSCEYLVHFQYTDEKGIIHKGDNFALPSNRTHLEIHYKERPLVINLRWAVSALTLVLVICLEIRYIINFEYLKLKLLIKSEENFCCSKNMFWFFVELILLIVHPPPHKIFNYMIKFPQTESHLPPVSINLSFVLTIFMLFARSYLSLKFFIIHSKWSDPAYEKICHEYHTIQDNSFYFKAEFLHHSFFIIATTFLLAICVFGYSVRCVEMVFMNVSDIGLVRTNNDWRFFWNGMWCVIITMATVGFGDFAPISLLGRILTLVSCSFGTLMISLLIASLENVTEFSSNETIAYDTIKHNQEEILYGSTAIKFLQCVMR